MKDNKLIAEFMGLKFSKGEYYRPLYNSGDWIPENELQYHNSWDWLMPVVKEVLTRYEVDEGIEIDYDELLHAVMDNDIERAHEEVVEFIKQYNKYPFNEGDDYWVLEDGDLVWGVWDDASEDMHDENPNRQYFTQEEVMDHVKTYGVKLYKQ